MNNRSRDPKSLCIVWAGVKLRGRRRGPFNDGIESIAFAEFCTRGNAAEVMERAMAETGGYMAHCCVLESAKAVAMLLHLGFGAMSRTSKPGNGRR